MQRFVFFLCVLSCSVREKNQGDFNRKGAKQRRKNILSCFAVNKNQIWAMGALILNLALNLFPDGIGARARARARFFGGDVLLQLRKEYFLTEIQATEKKVESFPPCLCDCERNYFFGL